MTAQENGSEILTRESILVGLPSNGQDAAIEQAAKLLMDRSLVGADYAEAMRNRETTFSTYLGNGVALPHGTFEMKDQVLGTGIVVTQYPDGVPWGDETAYLVIGLAATNDDHVHVLSQLAEVLQDEELCERLWKTDDIDLIYDTLQAEAP